VAVGAAPGGGILSIFFIYMIGLSTAAFLLFSRAKTKIFV
jgi:hypothetical protein